MSEVIVLYLMLDLMLDDASLTFDERRTPCSPRHCTGRIVFGLLIGFVLD